MEKAVYFQLTPEVIGEIKLFSDLRLSYTGTIFSSRVLTEDYIADIFDKKFNEFSDSYFDCANHVKPIVFGDAPHRFVGGMSYDMTGQIIDDLAPRIAASNLLSNYQKECLQAILDDWENCQFQRPAKIAFDRFDNAIATLVNENNSNNLFKRVLLDKLHSEYTYNEKEA